MKMTEGLLQTINEQLRNLVNMKYSPLDLSFPMLCRKTFFLMTVAATYANVAAKQEVAC